MGKETRAISKSFGSPATVTSYPLIPLLAAIFVFAVACDSPDPAPDALPSPGVWAEARDNTGFRQVTEASTICRNDCLSFERLVLLGEDDGSGFLKEVGVVDIVVDTEGRYWVGQLETIKVFDSAGTFLREIGRQGQGPMEF